MSLTLLKKGLKPNTRQIQVNLKTLNQTILAKLLDAFIVRLS